MQSQFAYSPNPPPPPSQKAPDSASQMLLLALVVQALVTLFWVYLSRYSVAAMLTFGVLGVIMLLLAYVFTYQRSLTPDYPKAVGPTLLFGILGIFVGLIIGGVFYFVAYSRLSTAVQVSVAQAAQPRTVVYETVVEQLPAPPRHCAFCGADYPSNLPACPQCGAPG